MSPGDELMLCLIGIGTLGFAFVVVIVLFQERFYKDAPFDPS